MKQFLWSWQKLLHVECQLLNSISEHRDHVIFFLINFKAPIDMHLYWEFAIVTSESHILIVWACQHIQNIFNSIYFCANQLFFVWFMCVDFLLFYVCMFLWAEFLVSLCINPVCFCSALFSRFNIIGSLFHISSQKYW